MPEGKPKYRFEVKREKAGASGYKHDLPTAKQVEQVIERWANDDLTGEESITIRKREKDDN